MANPSFEALPLKKDGPRGNAWGLFGDNDQLGMLNLLTPETTIAASKEITHGIRVSVNWPMDEPKKPCFNRVPFKQTIHHKAPRAVNDDILAFNTQSSSQWDGFRHYAYQDRKLYFNGTQQSDIHDSTTIGIHSWVESGGIVGRGVLLDYYSWAKSQGQSIAPLSTHIITVADLEKVAAHQKVSLQPGDILLIRSGYLQAFQGMSTEEAETFASLTPPPAIGVESSKEMLKWIWDTGFAAVAGDMASFEAWPCQNLEYHLHEWLLAGWGLPIGEFFDLERLAEVCEEKKKWSFFFSSMPLNVPGGVASPPNAVAIL